MARILVAEDEPDIRDIIDRALSGAGHSVVTAADGAAALEQMRGQKFDLLLTDIVMPIMDGVALALNVAKAHPDVRILMMTGYADQRDRAHNLDLLIHDIVLKPFTIGEIVLKVDEALSAPHRRG
ncbi:MAG: response regulator [Minwuia sp.]|uniref:response regulator n=1 Tax=Minwuia sp. TaxID=2493630 RepID=UPI003A85134A